MPYLFSKRHNGHTSSVLLGIALVVVILLTVGNVPIPSGLTMVTHTIASPLWNIRDTVTRGFTIRSHTQETQEALVRMHMETQTLLEQTQRQTLVDDVMKREYELLMTLIERGSIKDGLLPVSVLLTPELSPYDTFIIDIGTTQGARPHMLLLTHEGVAVGYLTRTDKDTSVASLFSAPDTETSVVIMGTTTLQATLEGLGGTMRIRLPRDLEVSLGDSVVIPRFRGAPIGTITAIHVEPEDAFQTLYVTSPTNIYTLRYVVVDTQHVWSPTTPHTGTENLEPETYE